MTNKPEKKQINKTLLGILIISAILIPLVLFMSSRLPDRLNISLKPELTRKVLDEDVKDIWWLNNNELAYTYFDRNSRNRALAKTNGKKITSLLNNPEIKMSEVFWSNKNTLLIYDYGIPYKTYLYDEINGLRFLPIQGYAFSWLPNGESFFYQNQEGNLLEQEIYNVNDGQSIRQKLDYPDFNVSLWSPTENKVLLYNFDLETGKGQLRLIDVDQNKTMPISDTGVTFVSWSPTGTQFAFMQDQNIIVSGIDGSKKEIYNSIGKTFPASYSWIKDDQILVFDGSTGKLQLISISSGESQEILLEIKPDTNQRVQVEISPDSKTLAIASEKNGLWFVDSSLLKQP